ncbi:hypothetical protein [Croceibacterium ferulae]|uniref:hypothetical protein n=1 Tax=Croceibacterium ferulae TaxID=1854641 RepID=UPI000F872527|nr:hypothetical protein [Croceibacterium ferulae]
MDDEYIRWRDKSAKTHRSTLCGVLAALAGGALDSFLGLRAHQREPWHAFCVQIAALALSKAGLREMPYKEGHWRALLLKLTPEWPDGEAWSLVVDDWTRPALLQPPLANSGNLPDYRNTVTTPDRLDVLLTSKNHDLKRYRMHNSCLEDWLFALVTLQTTEGFQGAGNYGISRMNGGFGTRMTFGWRATESTSAAFRMDVQRLLSNDDFSSSWTGVSLLWLEPWDGRHSLAFDQLDPLYVEVCRRVRLKKVLRSIVALTATSSAPRVASAALNGRTNDPWVPIKQDMSACVTPSSAGFGYRQITRLLDPARTKLPVLARSVALVPEEKVALLAAALVRGQGKTEGLHRRTIALPAWVASAMVGKNPVEKMGRVASARAVKLASVRTGLQRALLSLFQGGPEQIQLQDEAGLQKAERWLIRFDEAIDLIFFDPSFWEHVIRDQDESDETWRRRASECAFRILEEAMALAPRRALSRMRAAARAVNYLELELPYANKGASGSDVSSMKQEPNSTEQVLHALSASIIALPVHNLAQLRRTVLVGHQRSDILVGQLLQGAGAQPHTWLEPASFTNWRFIAYAMAVLAGTTRRPPHSVSNSFGAALFWSGYSESRLLRLTSARGEAMIDQVRIAINMIAKVSQAPINLLTVKNLLEEPACTGRGARMTIAQDFYNPGRTRTGLGR